MTMFGRAYYRSSLLGSPLVYASERLRGTQAESPRIGTLPAIAAVAAVAATGRR
jgi:hypothetical protein